MLTHRKLGQGESCAGAVSPCRRRGRLLMLVAAPMLLMTLGGAPGMGRPSAGAHRDARRQVAGNSRIRPGRTLRGTMRVRRFVIPSGRTVRAASLNVVARGDIEIDGRLMLSPGARLHLQAGGRLRVASRARLVSEAPAPVAGPPLGGAGQAQKLPPRTAGPGGTNQYLAGTEGVVVDGNLTARGTVKIATADSATIVVNGRIRTLAGLDSSHPALNGADGGSIILGGYFGRNRLVRIGPAGALISGDGSQGWNPRGPPVPKPATNPCHEAGGAAAREELALHATDGGRGGTIRVMAERVSVDAHAAVQVGAGGHGGNVGDPAEPEVAGDGAPPDPLLPGLGGAGGEDLRASAGAGGGGGSLVVDSPDAHLGGGVRAGVGGDAGSIEARAGNGSPGCDGGRTFAALDLPGLDGSGPAPGARPAPGGISLIGGGGGDADSGAHSGGGGGPTQLVVPRRRSAKGGPYRYLAGRIALADYGNGGRGYAGCRPTSAAPGSAGGSGGALSVSHAAYTLAAALNGGDGGSGRPAGRGGHAGEVAAGAPARSVRSLLPGKDGAPCAPASYHYLVTLSAGGSAWTLNDPVTLLSGGATSSFTAVWDLSLLVDPNAQTALSPLPGHQQSTASSFTGTASVSYTAFDAGRVQHSCSAGLLSPSDFQALPSALQLAIFGMDPPSSGAPAGSYAQTGRIGLFPTYVGALPAAFPNCSPPSGSSLVNPGITADIFAGVDSAQFPAADRVPLQIDAAQLGQAHITASATATAIPGQSSPPQPLNSTTLESSAPVTYQLDMRLLP